MPSVPLLEEEGATVVPNPTPRKSRRSSRPILKCSPNKSPVASKPALRKPKAPLHLTRKWRTVQTRVEWLVHRHPVTGEMLVVGVARVLEALRRHQVAGRAVAALPRLADKLQQIVMGAPEHVPGLEARMDRILATLPPNERN